MISAKISRVHAIVLNMTNQRCLNTIDAFFLKKFKSPPKGIMEADIVN